MFDKLIAIAVPQPALIIFIVLVQYVTALHNVITVFFNNYSGTFSEIPAAISRYFTGTVLSTGCSLIYRSFIN